MLVGRRMLRCGDVGGRGGIPPGDGREAARWREWGGPVQWLRDPA